MTGNMDFCTTWRDERMAEDVSKKADLGWFDVEFTVYGCAYRDADGLMRYRVSTSAEDIYDWIEKAWREDLFPGRVERLTHVYPVPAGMKEYVAGEVKRLLAHEMQGLYDPAFFELLGSCAREVRNDQAAPLLWERADRIEGLFDEEALSRFERAVRYCYGCRRLERPSYEALLEWLASERSSMDDSFTSKDRFEADMCGVAWLDGDRPRVVVNAMREYVCERACALEGSGKLVSPIMRKTYWYNYDRKLADVRREFKDEMVRECDRAFLDRVALLRGSVGPEARDAFLDALSRASESFSDAACETLRWYGHHWNVLEGE